MMWGNSPATNQEPRIETGTVEEYIRERDIHRVRLDRGQVVEANVLDLGMARAIRRDQKVIVMRTTTMQWSILGGVPIPNTVITGDPEVDGLYARQPEAAPAGIPTYRLPGREVLLPDDKEIEARSDTSFARLVLLAAGGVVLDAGKVCYRYMNGIKKRIFDFCSHYLIKTPGITISAQALETDRKAQISLQLKPALQEGLSELNNLNVVAGADAVNSADTAPNDTSKGEAGELTTSAEGNPGIGVSLGEFIKMMASAQSGKVRVAIGETNSFEIDTTQLLAQISQSQLVMDASGVTIQTGNETISLGLEQLLFTLSALTMTISGAADITAASIALNGTTTIEGYQFLTDLINKLNVEWLINFNAHTHVAAGIPTTGPSAAFTTIIPTGT